MYLYEFHSAGFSVNWTIHVEEQYLSREVCINRGLYWGVRVCTDPLKLDQTSAIPNDNDRMPGMVAFNSNVLARSNDKVWSIDRVDSCCIKPSRRSLFNRQLRLLFSHQAVKCGQCSLVSADLVGHLVWCNKPYNPDERLCLHNPRGESARRPDVFIAIRAWRNITLAGCERLSSKAANEFGCQWNLGSGRRKKKEGYICVTAGRINYLQEHPDTSLSDEFVRLALSVASF